MSQNLTMSPDLGTEDWDPDVITRMIFIGPGAHVSEQEVVTAFHMLGLPLTIKNTCYGSMISGKSEDVYKAIEEIRKLYSGPITYEFTPASRKAYDLNWFKELDFLSYSYYPPPVCCWNRRTQVILSHPD